MTKKVTCKKPIKVCIICVVGVHNLHRKSMLDNFLIYLELIQTTFDAFIHNLAWWP